MAKQRLTIDEIKAEPSMSKGEKQFVLKLLQRVPGLYAVRQHNGEITIVGIKLKGKSGG